MSADHAALLADVERYYAGKLSEHGAVAQGVDWNGEASQNLRFAQLLRVCEGARDYSLNDLGCGFGSLLGYLRAQGQAVRYSGFDVSQAMIDKARELHGGVTEARFVVAAAPDVVADFTLASGIFNVRLNASEAAWRDYMLHTLGAMNQSSRLGFAFNCLTRYSDPERMRPQLHYADPCFWFDHCKRSFARNVALLHDYDLYEFTLIVRKNR